MDLVVGHVAPAIAQGTNVSARKRQGNVVLQGNNPAGPIGKERTPGDNPAGPAGKERAPGVAAAVRSARPPAEKMSKVSGVKRKKVPSKRPSSTPSAPARCSPTVPFNGVASTAGEVFDEMAGSGGSNNVAAKFVNLLDTNVVDIDQAPVACFDYNELKGGVDDHGGEDEVGEEKIAQHRYKDIEAFEIKIFKLEHCWEMLKDCDKWKLIDRESSPKTDSLTNMDEDEDDDGPRNLNKPDGDKKTKEKIKRKQEASSLRDKIDAMVQPNEVMLAQSMKAKIELAEKKAREKQER
ncbi:Lactation elevated protein 1 [Hordeum vulgare]|nr:Lactation elevated protein 1 [Hordeum vulgare]